MSVSPYTPRAVSLAMMRAAPVSCAPRLGRNESPEPIVLGWRVLASAVME